MFITIWDLDWYYSKDKTNLQNPNAMLISSYHKQLGDQVNFVQTEYDIKRPYNIYYILKEKDDTPNPPIQFLLDNKIRWIGASCLGKRSFKLPPEVLSCRPDYLLYPNKETRVERSDYIHLFDLDGRLLKKTQDVENSFKNKYVIVSDKNMWGSSEDELKEALRKLGNYNHVSFKYPIRLQRILFDKQIQEAFLNLKLSSGSKITWEEIPDNWCESAIDFCLQCKNQWPHTKIGPINLTYTIPFKEVSKQWELFNYLTSLILKGKQSKIYVNILFPNTYQINTQKLAAPYMFQELAAFSMKNIERSQSWFEYLCFKYSGATSRDECLMYLNFPHRWHPEFRDLIRQTYKQRDFFLLRWGDDKIDERYIPWNILDKEFQYGL